MDAVAYQMSFDKEQLALLCANYDRRIDSLGAENKRLQTENAKLRELVEYMHRCFVRGHDWGPYCEGETVWVEQRMRELGVDA